MKKELRVTADGSHTFYIEELDEQYHSMHGSIAEAQHIFINAGLLKKAESMKAFKIFEVGMGTGLNVYLTAIAAAENQLNVEMHSIEAYPIEVEEVGWLNYPKQLKSSEELFHKIHESKWNELNVISENLSLKKIAADLKSYTFEEEYDVIYFDAFAPEKQEEMWEKEVFLKIYQAMKVDGILVTYCVKGVIRRLLKEIGFTVEKLAGPINGKREMLRAIKS